MFTLGAVFTSAIPNGYLRADLFADLRLESLAIFGAGEAPPAAQLLQFLPFIAIGVLFYFMFIRPDRQRRTEQAEMLENLKKNDRVVTTGGIHGTIVNVNKNDKIVVLKVDEKSDARLRVARTSILRVLNESDSESTSA